MYDVVAMLSDDVDRIYHMLIERIFHDKSVTADLRHTTAFLGGFHYADTGD